MKFLRRRFKMPTYTPCQLTFPIALPVPDAFPLPLLPPQLYGCMPDVLLPLLSHLKSELESEPEARRAAAVDLVAQLYCTPESDVAAGDVPLMESFLNRFIDQKTEVRLRAVGHIGALTTAGVPFKPQVRSFCGVKSVGAASVACVAGVAVLGNAWGLVPWAEWVCRVGWRFRSRSRQWRALTRRLRDSSLCKATVRGVLERQLFC